LRTAFDWVEIRAVGRQIGDHGIGCFDGFSDAGHLVRRLVVHDHDVGGLEGRRQRLLEPSEETSAADRAVEDARRGDAVMTQAGDKGRGSPMAEGSTVARSRQRLSSLITKLMST